MSELADSSEKEDGLGFLRDYEQRLDALMNLLSTRGQKAEARKVYRALKEDLKADKDRLRTRQTREEITHVEDAFLRPAVSRALAELKPATNSDPDSSRWLDAVYQAHVQIVFMRNQLETPG